MNNILRPISRVFRSLFRKPGFTAAVILTLTLGIGANAVVFSFLSGYLFKPLPYPDSSRLVQVDIDLPKLRAQPFTLSPSYYRAIRDRSDAFSASALYTQDNFNLKLGSHARRVGGITASASLFQVLGVQPMLGRIFATGDAADGTDRVAVISYALWQSGFHGKPDAVGQLLIVDGTAYRVIGVMPRGFAFPDRSVALWMPKNIAPADYSPDHALNLGQNFIGRLMPGVSEAAAQARVRQTINAWNQTTLPANLQAILHGTGFHLRVQSYHQVLLKNRALTLWLLQGAALLILLITCVNVANLLLSRILGRSHEMALRSALGATRRALAGQLLMEAGSYALLGGAAGIGLAWIALRFLSASPLGAGDSIFNITLDWRVGLFTFAAVVVVSLLVSVLPVRHLARNDLTTALQEGHRTSAGHQSRRARNSLIVAELALATGLLAMAGLLAHSFWNVQAMNPGFRRDHVLIAGLLLPPNDHPGDVALRSFYTDLLQRVNALPGVRQASVAEYLPLGGASSSGFQAFSILGNPASASGKPPAAIFNTVSPGFFETLGIPLIEGRHFDAQDEGTTHAIVDTEIVKKYFPHTDPIGKTLLMGGMQHLIIGVAPTIRYAALSQTAPSAVIYVYGPAMPPTRHAQLVIHTELRSRQLVKPVAELLASVDPSLAVYDVHSMREQVARSMGDTQMALALLLIFGGLALALVIVGVYAVMSYAVAQRRVECGVRLALGASPRGLLWLVIGDGMKLLALALVIGLAISVIFGSSFASVLFGITPYDPVALIGAALILVATTFAACWIPAWRASRVPPMEALRE